MIIQQKSKINRWLIGLCIFFVLGVLPKEASAASVSATVRIGVCGNGEAEPGEECDGDDFKGANCSVFGYAEGDLVCLPDCAIDSSNCFGEIITEKKSSNKKEKSKKKSSRKKTSTGGEGIPRSSFISYNVEERTFSSGNSHFNISTDGVRNNVVEYYLESGGLLRRDYVEGENEHGLMIVVAHNSENSKVEYYHDEKSKENDHISATIHFIGNGESANKIEFYLTTEKILLISGANQVIVENNIFIDDYTGEFFVNTEFGKIRVNYSPEQIIEKAQKQKLFQIRSINLIERNNTLEYALLGKKKEKLFFIFPVDISLGISYDAQTGEWVKIEQSFLWKVLDFFSF